MPKAQARNSGAVSDASPAPDALAEAAAVAESPAASVETTADVSDIAPVTDTTAEAVPAPEPVRHTHEGVNYLALLSAIHRQMQPTTYLEIGSDRGESLRLARCSTIAIDPKFKITSDVIGEKPSLHLFQQSSDSFFATGIAPRLLPQGLDLAFLDGMHLFEYLLRDFINTEKLCHWRSAILLHDCLPPNIEIAERDYRPHLRTDEMWRIHWTGDVWKLIPILQRYRPDLTLTLFDAPPSGLVLITGLDADNTVLQDAYADIIAEYRAFSFDKESYHRFFEGLKITHSDGLLDGVALSAYF
jgi:hypothetical protein